MHSAPRPSIALFSFVVIVALSAAGCSREPAASAATAANSSATAAPAAAPSANPGATAAADGADMRVITGDVVETMDASSYTYVKVKTGAEEIWAAAGKFDVAVGDRVVVPLETPMENFHSAALDRDFPLIYFASRITREGEAGGAAPSVAQMPMSSHGSKPAPPQVTEVIQPPAGGISVAKVWETRKTLSGQSVTVRGQVVKVNNGIMGRNWIHIQDGTGRADDRTNDLTITTDAVANKGDVITATGTIAVDKDFGAGYAYPVILENATIKRTEQ